MYDDHICWSCVIIIDDDHIWSSYMMIIYDHHIWWSYMMIIYDDHVWWKCWWTCWRTFEKYGFASEMFGDLWDMFWHHHWCLRTYQEPLTIIFSNKIKGSTKTQNARSAIFHYLSNSEVSVGVDLCTSSFFIFWFILVGLRLRLSWRHNRLSGRAGGWTQSEAQQKGGHSGCLWISESRSLSFLSQSPWSWSFGVSETHISR